MGRLIFKNWIDIATMDSDGPGSRILAELIAWQAVNKRYLETPEGAGIADVCQQILRDSNRTEVLTAVCQAMNEEPTLHCARSSAGCEATTNDRVLQGSSSTAGSTGFRS